MLDWDRVSQYKQVRHFLTGNGYIVWRTGTGLNTEIVYLRSYVARQGTGRFLLRTMLDLLLADPPYETIYGFTRTVNTDAQAFYTAMGFDLSHVKGVYRDGSAVLFSQTYSKLKEIHNVS